MPNADRKILSLVQADMRERGCVFLQQRSSSWQDIRDTCQKVSLKTIKTSHPPTNPLTMGDAPICPGKLI